MKVLKFIVLPSIALGILLVFAIDPLRTAWYRQLNSYAIAYYKSNLSVFHERVSRNLPSQAVLFYGDSLVQGLAVDSVATTAVNFGIGHARVNEVSENLRGHARLEEARAIVVGVGINDILAGESEGVAQSYRALLDAIPGTAPIIVSLVLPVDENIVQQDGINAKVAQVNKALMQMCEKIPRASCLSWSEAILLPSGQLDPWFHIGDGLHLNARGNALWIQNLREKLDEVKAANED